MKLKANWKDTFEHRTLERGLYYQMEGEVTELRCSLDATQAVVHGAEDYHVQLSWDENGELQDMNCDCPYARDGKACKHMVAALFEIEKRTNTDENETASDESVWHETLRHMTEEQLRESVERELRQEDRWKKTLVLQWKRCLEQITESCRSYGGDISYKEADWFYEDLVDFVAGRCPILIARKEYMEAFSVACMAYQTAMQEQADDSDGGMTCFVKVCGRKSCSKRLQHRKRRYIGILSSARKATAVVLAEN